jgi:hypothetical protein
MAACEEHHMSIGEAARCGCVRPAHRELWAADIVSNPDLFRRHGGHTVTAYMSTKTTNRVPTPVVAGRADGRRCQTRHCSVRVMHHMASGMGHLSDLHLQLAIQTCVAGDAPSYFAGGYSGCVTGFHAHHSENQVATVETIICRRERYRKEIPHLRFPAPRTKNGVEFPKNRMIIPVCGTLERAVARIPPPNPLRDVPIGYNPSRWQAVVEAHDRLRTALTVRRVDENASWPAIVSRAVAEVAASHRARSVSIARDEMQALLGEMARRVTREKPQLEPDELVALCREYSTALPATRAVPEDLTGMSMGAMRNRRTIMCHTQITDV